MQNLNSDSSLWSPCRAKIGQDLLYIITSIIPATEQKHYAYPTDIRSMYFNQFKLRRFEYIKKNKMYLIP